MMSYIKSSSNVGKSCLANNEGNFIIQNNYVSFLTERAIILLITADSEFEQAKCRLFFILIRENSMAITRNTWHRKVIYRQVRP